MGSTIFYHLVAHTPTVLEKPIGAVGTLGAVSGSVEYDRIPSHPFRLISRIPDGYKVYFPQQG